MANERKVVDCYFVDNNRNTVEVFWEDVDGQYMQVVNAEEGEPDWEEILSQWDEDAIHERTFKFIKQQRQDFEAVVRRIAEEEGLLSEQDTLIRAKIVEDLIQDDPEQQDPDELFKFKLSIFELDYIKQSTNRGLKAKLRKADTMLAVIECIIEFKKDK